MLWLAIEPGQALEGQDGVSAVGDACTNDPCTTMFTPSDIVVTANTDFLAANPAAASLLENFELAQLAVAVQAVAIDAGANSDAEIAAAGAGWIAANRDKDRSVDRGRARCGLIAGRPDRSRTLIESLPSCDICFRRALR